MATAPLPFDLQLNGYAGVDFAAADVTPALLAGAAEAVRRDGGGQALATLITDGIHVPPFALSNYLRAAGLDRAIAVTDATAAGGMGPGRFRLGSRAVVAGDDGAAWSEDRTHLLGSTAGMGQVQSVLAGAVGLSPGEVERLTVENPRAALA